LEIGPKDLPKSTIVLARRDNGKKETVAWDQLSKRVTEVMDDIQKTLLANATKIRDERVARITKWEEFIPSLDARKIVLSPWCDQTSCEDEIKVKTSGKKEEKTEEQLKKEEEFEPLTGAAKSLCIPFEQPPLADGAKCFHCGNPAKHWCMWGRSY